MSPFSSRFLTTALFALALVLSSPGCQGDDRVIGRGKLGKADLIGSCENSPQDFCGGMSDGTCYCDNSCTEFGDCCDDKASICDAAPGSCETQHTPCNLGEGECWSFGAEEGLSFSGDFVPECDETGTCLVGECQVNLACGLDAPCPGLCALDNCTL